MRLILLESTQKLIAWFTGAISLLRLVERHQAGESLEDILSNTGTSQTITVERLASLTRYFQPLLTFLPEMQQVHDQLTEISITVETTEINRKTEVRQRNQALRDLEVATRGAMSTLLAQQRHLKHPRGQLVVKGLEVERPKNRSLEWITMAEKVARVQASLIKLGYPPINTPAIEDIQAYKEKTIEGDARVRVSQGNLIVYRMELKERKQEARDLFSRIAAFIKFYYSKETKTHIREIMRLIGYTFKPIPKARQAEAIDTRGEASA